MSETPDDFKRAESHDCPMPTCAAPAGSPCRTGKGKVAIQYHTARFRLVPRLAKALSVPTPPYASQGRCGPSCPGLARHQPLGLRARCAACGPAGVAAAVPVDLRPELTANRRSATVITVNAESGDGIKQLFGSIVLPDGMSLARSGRTGEAGT